MVENKLRPKPQLRLVSDSTLRADALPVEPQTDRHAFLRRIVAIVAALLLHFAAFQTLIADRSLKAPAQPEPISIELAYEPPKPVEAAPTPAEDQPLKQQQPLPDRRSGGDLENVPPGPPPADTPAPQPAPPVAETPPPATMPLLPDLASPRSEPVPPPATQQVMIPPPLPPTKPPVPTAPNAAVPAAAEPPAATASPDADLKLGEGGGDRYLNATKAKILRHLVYPPTAELFHITGMAIYEIVINRQGELLDVRLTKSTDSDILDNAGFQTIRMSAPFGPVPDDIPGSRIGLILELSMGPER